MPQLDAMEKEPFVAAVGWVFEHSPWVAERAWPSARSARWRAPRRDGRHRRARVAPGAACADPRTSRSRRARAHQPCIRRRTGRRRPGPPDAPRSSSGCIALNCGLSREVRLPLYLRREGQHASTISSGARTPAWRAIPRPSTPRHSRRSTASRNSVWRTPFHATNFMSGGKRNYYGKGDVIVYRLNRDGQTPPARVPSLAPTS